MAIESAPNRAITKPGYNQDSDNKEIYIIHQENLNISKPPSRCPHVKTFKTGKCGRDSSYWLFHQDSFNSDALHFVTNLYMGWHEH